MHVCVHVCVCVLTIAAKPTVKRLYFVGRIFFSEFRELASVREICFQLTLCQRHVIRILSNPDLQYANIAVQIL